MNKRIPELLSPAGNLQCAVAAFEGGADAVYCGLSRFNARARAGNFELAELCQIIRYANKLNRKVYVVVNTLLKEVELPQLMDMLNDLQTLRPHAFIIQDLGVLELCQRYFPHIPIHASTQMGIHNSSGVEVAANLGIKRVILERQVTLDELEDIAKKSPVELEVFIHGSLCCSLSGRCLLSAVLEDSSGNRGCCKQPCRRSYDGLFLLSPGDLMSVDILNKLYELNIASLKIEGRLRSPEYVYKTAQAYRILLDRLPKGLTQYDIIEATNILRSSVSRRTTRGFFFKEDYPTLINPKLCGVLGVPTGIIEKQLRRGIVVKVLNRLHLGDKLRPVPKDGGNSESFTLINMIAPGREEHSLNSAKKDDTVFIPNVTGTNSGWLLFKIGENGYDFARRINSLPKFGIPIDFHINISYDSVKVSLPNGKLIWQKDCNFDIAIHHELAIEDVINSFLAGSLEPWSAGNITVEIAPQLFLPASVLKSIRREFWEYMTTWKPEESKCKLPDIAERIGQYTQVEKMPKVDFTIKGFIPETALDSVKAKIQKAYKKGARTFRVEGIHGFDLLKDYKDIKIIAAFPLPVCNSMGIALLEKLGANGVVAEPELNEKEILDMTIVSTLPVYIDNQKAPLLVSRLPLLEGEFVNRRNNTIVISFDKEEELYTVNLKDEK
jgi:putative protease